MGRVSSHAALVLRSLRNENRLKQIAKRRVHRFRSWSHLRSRGPYGEFECPVVLTADPEAMNASYLSRCILKAAQLRKNDLSLWEAYTTRMSQLKDRFTAEELAIVFYGFGKSLYPKWQRLRELLPYVVNQIHTFSSQGLMCVIWCLTRFKYNDRGVILRIAEETVRRSDQIRPIDCLKIFNCTAAMGVPRSPLTSTLSEILLKKMDQLSSQNFRFAVHPVALMRLHTPKAQKYILERLIRIRATLRPEHLRAAYRAAVAFRVLQPAHYAQLSSFCRRYLTRLSLLRIPWEPQYPSVLHWDVSASLLALNLYHKNMFLWGCYWIDVGELQRKDHCWMIDPPSAFYTKTFNYTAAVKLEHQVLWNLGWEIRRIAWAEWIQLNTAEEKKKFLKAKMANPSDPERVATISWTPRTPVRDWKALEALYLQRQTNHLKSQNAAKPPGRPQSDLPW